MWSVRRALGIMLLVPGLLRIPLPQADYHNIRHHDGAGEICPYHDHLLRWHPTASRNDDVAVFHWHWLAPQSVQPGSGDPREHGDPSPNTPPSLHAYLPDCVEPDWNSSPAIRAESCWRILNSLSLLAGLESAACLSAHPFVSPPATGPPWLAAAATPPNNPGPLTLAERWNC